MSWSNGTRPVRERIADPRHRALFDAVVVATRRRRNGRRHHAEQALQISQLYEQHRQLIEAFPDD
jgi:hypothetical protein